MAAKPDIITESRRLSRQRDKLVSRYIALTDRIVAQRDVFRDRGVCPLSLLPVFDDAVAALERVHAVVEQHTELLRSWPESLGDISQFLSEKEQEAERYQAMVAQASADRDRAYNSISS